MILLLLHLACANDPPPSGKEMVVVGGQVLDAQGEPVAPPPAGTAFTTLAVSCCETGQEALSAYLRAAEALSRDDAAAASTALQELAAHPDAADLGPLAGPLVGLELKPMRAGFKALAIPTATFVRARPGGTLKVAAVWCPMAPGWWLQSAEAVANPYHGSEMLRCGSFVALDDVK